MPQLVIIRQGTFKVAIEFIFVLATYCWAWDLFLRVSKLLRLTNILDTYQKIIGKVIIVCRNWKISRWSFNQILYVSKLRVDYTIKITSVDKWRNLCLKLHQDLFIVFCPFYYSGVLIHPPGDIKINIYSANIWVSLYCIFSENNSFQ